MSTVSENADGALLSPFKSVLNFRDVGTTVNQLAGQRCAAFQDLSKTGSADAPSQKTDKTKLTVPKFQTWYD